MREKVSQTANAKGSPGQGRNCHVERVSKKNRESGRGQWSVPPPPFGLEGESVLWWEGVRVLQDGALHRAVVLREEVGERRPEEVWGIPEGGRGQRG